MKVVDLFSGCGGMSLGFQNAGFQIVGAFDQWEPAIHVYKMNFTHPIYNYDLQNESVVIPLIKSLVPDIIIGGPPCQDFSSAGKRDENNGKGDLTISFANIISSVSPLFFVMENVDRIVKTKKYIQALDIFKKSGYGLSTVVLDASFCGVPQKRKRFFMIGVKDGEDNVFLKPLLENLSQKPTTIRDYLGDSLDVEHYYRHPRNYSRRGVFSIDEPSPTIRGVNRPIPKGYLGHPKDSTKNFSIVRPLTTIERSYLQTFPDTFIFEGKKTNLEQMIGNAVPVKLAEYVAKSIQQYIPLHKKR